LVFYAQKKAEEFGHSSLFLNKNELLKDGFAQIQLVLSSVGTTDMVATDFNPLIQIQRRRANRNLSIRGNHVAPPEWEQ